MPKLRVLFITNMCPHYVRPLFEILAAQHTVAFYFTGGHESYWHKRNELKLGNFQGRYLKGLLLPGNFKITPGLFSLPWLGNDVIVKTIDDRFALPFVFCAAKLLGKPFVLWTGLWTHPQTFVHQLTFGITTFLYKHSDAIVTYGEHVRRYLIDSGIDQRKIFSAPHATNNADYNRAVPEADKAQLKDGLRIAAAGRIVLCVSRLEEGKGLEFLVEAMVSLKEKAILVLVGTGSQEQSLRDLCIHKKVRVVFAGHVANAQLYRYYAIGDIFVLPSVTTADFKEPWGIVINEAMNQGCPVITTDAVGAAMGGLVEEGKTGFIVPEKNSAQLARALAQLLTDEALRCQMADAGRLKMNGWTPQVQADGFAKAFAYVQNDH